MSGISDGVYFGAATVVIVLIALTVGLVKEWLDERR